LGHSRFKVLQLLKISASMFFTFPSIAQFVLLAVLISQLSAVSAFSQTLRRYTSLNHLAQAARAVLNNVSQINQMLADLNRVDFSNVQVSLPSARARVCALHRACVRCGFAPNEAEIRSVSAD